MLRLQKIVSQLKTSDEDLLRQESAIQEIRLAMTVTIETLRMIQLEFLSQMLLGLRTPGGATIRMLPSYVHKKPTSKIAGNYYALDLGGTNFRVLELKIVDGKVVQSRGEKFTIPVSEMTGTSEGLFGFIADCVAKVVPQGGTGNLGFTFSFPVEQHSIASGNLIAWTKGFTSSGVEGQDVVKLLQRAFNKRGVKLNIAALCNDTVGTLVTEYFMDSDAAVGVILGTGANACYWEKVPNIGKYYNTLSHEEKKAVKDDVMCINMECGNFDSWKHATLPVTHWDKMIDISSPNPGQQQYEKMLSGMYLGETCRLIFRHLQHSKVFPSTMDCMAPKDAFTTAQLSLCLDDTTTHLSDVDKHFLDTYKLTTTLRHRQIIREVCLLVARRSARLASAGIATIVTHMGVNRATISIDGSVFEKLPGYRKMMTECLDELYEGQQHNIKLVHTKDGSGVGAGLIAALEAK